MDVSGSSVDEQGNLVDGNGNRVDLEGNRIDENGYLLDDNGEHKLDDNGQYILSTHIITSTGDSSSGDTLKEAISDTNVRHHLKRMNPKQQKTTIWKVKASRTKKPDLTK